MSSGVDSSVTAALFASKYKNVRGIYMANWSQTAKCTESDWNDVQRVCRQLKIPCERVNFEKEYWQEVFTPMIRDYENGLTPNPDLGCNKYIKFGKMIEHLALETQSSESRRWLATGHYARIHAASNGFELLRGYDGNKDQSFYLANIPGNVLPHVLMPLGHYTKPEVRKLAKSFNLHTAEKPDSMGLCFVSPDQTKFRQFLDEYIPPNPGNIVTEDGKIWGTHQGLWHATVGQKLGISMPQGDPDYKGVWFVSEKRIDSNELVIVKGGNNEALFKNGLVVSDWEWLNPAAKSLESMSSLTLQYRSLQLPVEISSLKMESDETVSLVLKEKQRAMAPGQNIVLYNGNRVVGSGVIAKTLNH